MATPKGHPTWNAGTGKGWKDKRGYCWVTIVENGKRRAIRKHRLVMEQTLGRKLHPEELVHHINGDKTDNRPENLTVEDWGKHTTAHHTGTTRSDTTRRSIAVLAQYREEFERLRSQNADLIAALQAVNESARRFRGLDGVWIVDDAEIETVGDALRKAGAL